MLRLFIATPLGVEVENYLRSIIDDLRERGGGVKWVEPKNIHLTLRFLGDTREELVPKISNLIDRIAAEQKAISSQIDRIGGFPNLRRPRIIWAGLDRGVEELSKLARQIELAVRKLRFEKESKKFKAHLTLGRVRDHRPLRSLSDYLQSYQIEAMPMTFDRIVLFESTLTPRGPIYDRLHESILGVERFGD